VAATKGYELAGRRLFIALPAYDFKVSLKLAVSLAKFAQSAGQHGVDIQIGSICGCSVVSRARNLLAKDMLESDCTDLIFIDSDINFEAADIFRLMAWSFRPQEGHRCWRTPHPGQQHSLHCADMDYDENGELTMDRMGLVRATRVATAFMMVRRDVFEKMVEAHPEWSYYDKRSERELNAMFDFKVTDEGYMGEDFLFCDRTRELGFEVWIDPTITLGHMGVQEYKGAFGSDVLYPMIVPDQKVSNG
jgi:hypothetical protein